MVLEICVDSIASARAAQSGGAERVELCSDLLEGGITPSSGLIGSVRDALVIPMFVMIRPRAGDFFYSQDELEIMKRDITAAKSYGADGVVLGLLLQNGEVDVEQTRALVELARPLEVTFHRAIDRTPDLSKSVENVIATGADRILTSGGSQTAAQGMDRISEMIARANDRIGVMVCGGIRKENVGKIARKTGASEFHAALRKKTKSPMKYQNPSLSLGEAGIDEFGQYTVNAEDVRSLRDALIEMQKAAL